MYKWTKVVVASVVALSVVGCGGKVSYVDTQDSAEYTSAGIDYHDIEAAGVFWHLSLQGCSDRSQRWITLL